MEGEHAFLSYIVFPDNDPTVIVNFRKNGAPISWLELYKYLYDPTNTGVDEITIIAKNQIGEVSKKIHFER